MTIKSCYLDANLLVYYSDKASPFNKQAKEVIKRLVSESRELKLSSLTLDEYEFGSLHYSQFSRLEVLNSVKSSLRKIFKLPNIGMVNPPLETKKHFKVINLMIKYHLKPRDAYHLFIMLENKIKWLATFDSDFDKVFEEGRIKKFK